MVLVKFFAAAYAVTGIALVDKSALYAFDFGVVDFLASCGNRRAASVLSVDKGIRDIINYEIVDFNSVSAEGGGKLADDSVSVFIKVGAVLYWLLL